MPIIEELSGASVRECVLEAISREVPVAVVCRIETDWYTLDSRLLALKGDKLYLTCPTAKQGAAPALGVSAQVGLSFKLGHHKHVLNTHVESWLNVQVNGEVAKALCVLLPAAVQRIQRRAFNLVDVPRSRSVLATFWEGDLPATGADIPSDSLTWDGWVTNISAGGFQIRVPAQGARPLEVGDIVCVRIQAGQEYGPVVADVQFRRMEPNERGVASMSFQFVGLSEAGRGQQTLSLLSRIVCDFQRTSGKRKAYEHNLPRA